MQSSQTATINNNLTFGDIAKIKNGYAFKKTDFLQNGIPLIRQSNLGGTKVDLSGCVYLPESYLEKYKNFLLKKGDVLLGMSGSLGKICYYNLDQPALQNQRTGKVEITHPEKVTDRYFWYFLNTIESRLIGLSKGTGVNNVSASDIESLDIYLPSIDGQNNVTNKLDSYLPKVGMSSEKIVKAKQLLRKFRQSVLLDAVTGKLTEGWREKNEIGENAEEFVKNIQKISTKVVTIDKYEENENLPSWIRCKVHNLFSVQTGSTPYRKNESYYLNGTIPWVKTGEVQNCDIYSAEEKITQLAIKETNTKTFPINTILIAMYGEGKTRGQIGRLKIEAATNQACAALVNPKIPDYFNEYIYIYCLSQYSKLRQEAVGGNQPNLNLSKIKEWDINVPPEKEQQEIVNRVNKMFEYADIVEKHIEIANKRTEKLTQSILAKAFRGEL